MRHTLFATLVSGLALFPIAAPAVDLVTAYEQALSYDSELAQARAAYQAAIEGSRETLAPMLPDLEAFAQWRHQDQQASFRFGDSYKSNQFGLRLSQPLFRAELFYNYQASTEREKQASAELSAAHQQLMLDVSTAYFDVLRAEDTLTTAEATEAALKRQWEQARERHEVGLIAITEVLEARAAFDDSKSRRIRAENQLEIARETLTRRTGQRYRRVDKLEQDFPVGMPSPTQVDPWVTQALAQNWNIAAAEYQLKASRKELKSAWSGHLPTVDLNASWSQGELIGQAPASFSGGSVTSSQFPDVLQQTDTILTLDLTVPLYSGGGTQAGVRRVRAEVEQARQTLNTRKRDVELDTRNLFGTIINNIETVEAQAQAILSRRSALEATRAGYRVGTRNIVEVLDAEQAYYIALRDFANARYDYVVNTLRLKQSAGTLSPQDLIELDRWLSASAPGIEARAREAQEKTPRIDPQDLR